jgi:CheY-like chemotaxis protein
MQETEETKDPKKLRPQALKRSIMVIDDNADILDLVSTILQIDGYEIFTAQSGVEALKTLSEIKKPDLILLDLQLGEMSGPDFLVTLQERFPDFLTSVPVVFLTGMDQIPESCAVGFIRKPIADITQFLKDARNFIEAGVSGSRYQH